jgi:carbon storage regulator
MLVLSRKNGQRVRIGDDIEVTVLEVQNGRVKLGFSGPPEITIHREEVFRRLEDGTRPAGHGAKALAMPASVA